MKNKLIILLLLLTTWQAFAQNKQVKDPYIPILTDSMRWWQVSVSEFGIGCGEETIEESLLYNDTVYYRNDGAWFVEDTTEKRIYTMSSSNFEIANRHLMYDFSLNEGDSIWLPGLYGSENWYYVDSIRFIDTYAGPRKAWYLHYLWGDDLIYPVWVEGIGSLAGFRIFYFTPGMLYWGQGLLTCFYQGETLIYEHELAQQYDCALLGYLSTETLETKNDFFFYPNPADNTGRIKFVNSENKKVRIEIYDCYGRHIYNSYTTNGEFTVNTERFSSGIYFYIISDNKQIFYKNKFIVKH